MARGITLGLVLAGTVLLAATMVQAQMVPFGGYGSYTPPGPNLEPRLPSNLAPSPTPTYIVPNPLYPGGYEVRSAPFGAPSAVINPSPLGGYELRRYP